jgi:hypothetical protein
MAIYFTLGFPSFIDAYMFVISFFETKKDPVMLQMPAII